MNFFESLILGIVQGLTEFLPVSSSGHLLLIGYIFGNESSGDENLLFTIFVHLATAIATIYVFRKDVISLIKELWKYLRVRKKYWLAPIIFTMLFLGILIIFTQGSAIAPFIYTLF